RVYDGAAAGGAMGGHVELAGARRALFSHPHHVGNDVARSLDQNRVAFTDVLAPDLIEVVQGCVGYRDAGERDRTELGYGRKGTDSADLDIDLFDDGFPCCALNLNAIAHRGDRDTSPSLSCREKELTFA